MNTLQLLLISAFLIIVILLIITIVQTKSKIKLKQLKENEIQNYFKEKWKEGESNLLEKLKEKEKEVDKLDISLNLLKKELEEKEERYKEVNKDLNKYKIDRKKEIDEFITQEREDKFNNLGDWVRMEEEKEKERLSQLRNKNEEALKKEKEIYEVEIKEIKEELEDIRSRRAAINEEIRDKEEQERYNEIHSVNLTDGEKEDIYFLLSLEDKLHNKQVLYKLIWSTYLQPAYKNTFNNILGNHNPKNVIYCIENINTGKKYIGKTSAEVSKRWIEHIKTSLNIGTIKTTKIHKALYKHWDEFIFYIVQKTSKENLSELEKYYINFYESDKYGYNIKAGG